jgi:hypothetical protein
MKCEPDRGGAPRVLTLDTAGAGFSMSSTASLRIDRDGNSLPLPGKSTGWPENEATGLKYIPFWDNPMFGSVSRADGYSRAQTRQIGPFLRADRVLRVDDQGTEDGWLDPAPAREAAS